MRQRIGRVGPHHDVERRGRTLVLFVRHEQLRLHRAIRSARAHVLDDADDGHRLERVEAAADGAADRIDVGERVLGQLLVDDRDKRRIEAIAVVEVAAAHDRHLQRLEVIGRRRR